MVIPFTFLRNKLLVTALYWVIAVYVFGVWVWGADDPMTAFNGDPRSKLSGLLNGTAYNPFVQRALVPFLTQGIYLIIPKSFLLTVCSELTAIPKFQKEAARLGWEIDYLPKYLISLTIALCALVGFAFVLRSFYKSVYDSPREVTNTVPIIALLILPAFFHFGTHYIYDFPTLLLFTFGLLLVLQQRWLLYYIVFALGCINKETMVFLSLAFLLLFIGKLPKTKLAAHLGTQIFIFAGIKTFLVLYFLGNPGSTLEFHLWFNLDHLLRPYTFTSVVITAFLITVITYDWKSKPEAVRKTARLLFPFGLLGFVFGYFGEARAFYELYPIFFILASHTFFYSLLRFPYQVKPIQVEHVFTNSSERSL